MLHDSIAMEERKSSATLLNKESAGLDSATAVLFLLGQGIPLSVVFFWVRNSSQIQRCCSSLGLPPHPKYRGLGQAEVTLQLPLRGSPKLLRAAVFYHGGAGLKPDPVTLYALSDYSISQILRFYPGVRGRP